MIKINGIKIEHNNFPDGTLCLMNFNTTILHNPENNITWLYESDAELFELICITKHIQEKSIFGKDVKINLHLDYVPNSRLDRTHSNKEIFTLKYFCEIINNLNFDNVFVFDPHSYVTESLINKIRILDVSTIIMEVISKIKKECLTPITIYFPDDGAMKRYKDSFNGVDIIYGKKIREWETGKILGLDVYNERGEKVTSNDINGKTILMIDDIISYGGTMAYSADRLEELGAKKIYAYASHTENSALDQEKGTFLKRLDYGTIERLFTTNSIYNGNHKDIEIIHEF